MSEPDSVKVCGDGWTSQGTSVADAIRNRVQSGGSLQGLQGERLKISELTLPSSTQMQNSNLRQSYISGLNAFELNLSGSSLCRAWLSRFDLPNAFLNDVNVLGAYLQASRLDGSFAREMRFIRTTLSAVRWRRGVFEDCVFTGTAMRHSDFSESTFHKCSFVLTDVRRTSFSNCRFRKCVFDRNITEDICLTKATGDFEGLRNGASSSADSHQSPPRRRLLR